MTTGCCLAPCSNDAVADVQWHTDLSGTQQCAICQSYLDDMMERFKSMATINRMSLRIGTVGSICKQEEGSPT